MKPLSAEYLCIMAQPPKTKFIFLVLPEVHLMDLAGPDQTILESIDYGAPFEIHYVGINESTGSSAGLLLAPQVHYRKMKPSLHDYLVLPGSNVSYLQSQAFKQQVDLFAWIRESYEAGACLVSICAGSFILGECGLLNELQCTTHFKRTKQLQQCYPKALVQENILFTEDRRIFTSAGISSGIDLMLHIVERLQGGYFAHKVARELVIYIRRDGHNAQCSAFMENRNHIHTGIHSVQDYIVENISHKHSIDRLAELACMSIRNFTRLFKKESGITVHQYIDQIRLEKLKSLLKNPDLSRKQMAAQIGLESEKQLFRLMGQLKSNV